MTKPELPGPGELCSSFRIKSVTPLLRGAVVKAEHEGTGARVLHFAADDTENLFAICFPTPPPDNTGLPHIMEHATLAGSQRFPVREPFFEMLKMSMATFLNAMTGSDITYYPVASNVRKDLFNLAEVYVDAVFHPLLTEAVFMREGHHLTPARPEEPLGELDVSGIVFNEMKGYYSSPETRLYLAWMRGLLPETVYARNAGGEPEAIPDLIYQDFLAFHRRYYHPSNAWFFFYGDIPTADYLAFLEPRLAGFGRAEPPATQAKTEPDRWASPRSLEDAYPAEQPLVAKTYLTLHWWLGAELDPQKTILRDVLDRVLLGHEAAPLRKALIDSRLGQALTNSGFAGVGRQAVFSVGLKGSEPERAEAFEKLVLETLNKLVEQGITSEQVVSAFRQAAYYYLEIQPLYPMHIMERVVDVWPYGGEPLEFLDMGRHLEEAKARWEADRGLFARLIQEELLDNPHRLRIVMRPDPDWAAANTHVWAQRMRKKRQGMDEAALRRVAENAAEISRQAGEPNPPEAVARLPRLSIRDLPEQPRRLPTEITEIAGNTVIRGNLFSNGVSYLNIFIDLADLPQESLLAFVEYVSMFSRLGAAGQSYEKIAERKAAFTSGLGFALTMAETLEPGGRPMRGALLTCKTLDEQARDALALIGDALFRVEAGNPERLRILVAQNRAVIRSALVNSSLNYALLQSARSLSAGNWIAYLALGLPGVDNVVRMDEMFESEVEGIMERIEQARDHICRNRRLTVSFVGTDVAWQALEASLLDWNAALPVNAPGAPAEIAAQKGAQREALALPIQIAHCSQAMSAPGFHDPCAASLSLGCHLLNFDYMLSEIRLKGNAYGAGIRYSPQAEILQLQSFRDPSIARTLRAFAAVPEFASKAAWSRDDIDRAIIGVAKNEEKPLRPETTAAQALMHHLIGLTNERRDAFYQNLLAATPASVAAALEHLDPALFASAPVCVAAGRDKIEAANKELGDAALSIVEPALPV